jgi:hypothetical protein
MGVLGDEQIFVPHPVCQTVFVFIGRRAAILAYSAASIMSQSYLSPSVCAPVTDFIVVVSNEDEYLSGFHDFAEKVNRKLRNGYRLHGQPFNIGKSLCQAMVRCEETLAGVSADGGTHHPVEKH